MHGFLRVHVLFACVFEEYLLKPMRITACIFFNILKPMLFASRKSLEAKKRQQFVLKPMCQRCKYRRREPRRTWNLAPRRPSDKDNDLHMHAHAASPRPHARHARHERNENEDETKPISRLRGVGQAGLAPLNLRYMGYSNSI